jgi:TolA-binding protein
MEVVFIIPILALSIPIVAIISASRTKREQMRLKAQEGNPKHVQQLESRIADLEQQVEALSTQMIELDEQQAFTTRLLDDQAGKR